MCLVAIGFGAPASFVAAFLLRERRLPIVMGLFPDYGGGLYGRWSPEPAEGTRMGSCLPVWAGVGSQEGARATRWSSEEDDLSLTLLC